MTIQTVPLSALTILSVIMSIKIHLLILNTHFDISNYNSKYIVSLFKINLCRLFSLII